MWAPRAVLVGIMGWNVGSLLQPLLALIIWCLLPTKTTREKPRVWFFSIPLSFAYTTTSSLSLSPLFSLRFGCYISSEATSCNMLCAQSSGYMEMDPTGRYGRVCMLLLLVSFHSVIHSLQFSCFFGCIRWLKLEKANPVARSYGFSWIHGDSVLSCLKVSCFIELF